MDDLNEKYIEDEFDDDWLDDDDDDATYRLTPYSILLHVLDEYGIPVSNITPKIAEHLFEDFMEMLCKQGYVGRSDE